MPEAVDTKIVYPESKSEPLLSTAVGGIHVSLYPTPPDGTFHPTEQLYGTNESVRGLRERAELVARRSLITHFLGVGRPEKIAAQVSLLRPKKVTLTDINNQHIVDGISLFLALRDGLPIEDAYRAYEQELTNFMRHLHDVAPQPYVGGSQLDRWGTVDRLDRLLQKMGVTYTDAEDAFHSIDTIRIVRGDIKSKTLVDALTHPLQGEATIADFSNIPMSDIPQQVHIFSALNSSSQMLEEAGIREGVSNIGNNTIWHYPLPRGRNDMTLAYSPTFSDYQQVAGLVNTQGCFTW